MTMGCFSWFTQDTGRRILNDVPMRVIMVDDNHNQYIEECYEGYGVFGGKDYYELLAEMNGLGSDREAGIKLAFEDSPKGENPNCKHPSLTENGAYFLGRPPKTDPDQGFHDEDYSEEECYD